jgi:hypothetical protein
MLIKGPGDQQDPAEFRLGNRSQKGTTNNAFHRISTHFNAFQRISTHFNAFQRISTHFNAFQRISTHCKALSFLIFFFIS